MLVTYSKLIPRGINQILMYSLSSFVFLASVQFIFFILYLRSLRIYHIVQIASTGPRKFRIRSSRAVILPHQTSKGAQILHFRSKQHASCS